MPNNSKEFILPSGDRAFACVPTNPDTGEAFFSQSALVAELEVALTGMLNGKIARVFSVLGGRRLGWVDTVQQQDFCEYLDTSAPRANTPTVGQALYLVSTSANDTGGGSGARTIRLTYLDAGGVEAVMTASLDGLTPVNLGSGFSAVQFAEVASVGAGQIAAGNISISSVNGAATPATTFELVVAGGNRGMSGRYKIPSAMTGYVTSWGASGKNTTFDVRLRADVFLNGEPSAGVYHFIDRVNLGAGEGVSQGQNYTKLPPGTTIKLSAIPGGTPAGNQVEGGFALLLVSE